MSSPVRNSMTDRAIVQRVTEGSLNPIGQPIPAALDTVYTALDCRAWMDTESHITPTGQFLERTVFKMRAPLDAILRYDDKVSIGTDVVFRVKTIMTRNGHLLITGEEYGFTESPAIAQLRGAFSRAFGPSFDVVRVVG